MKSSIHITNDGNTIRAKGAAAQALFDALTKKPTTHELKCWPVYFQPLKRGEKTFELRRNDRLFQVGDRLKQNEWNPDTESYTDEQPLLFSVTFILHGPLFGLEAGWCIMSIRQLSQNCS